jgi:hypothetical protein
MSAADTEIAAMTAIAAALTPLDEEIRQRVMNWAAQRFNISLNSGSGARKSNQPGGGQVSKKDQGERAPSDLDDLIEFSEEDGFTFHFRDLKARSQSDAVNRLLHLALFAYENTTGQREVSRKILTKVLDDWRVNDGNARGHLNNHPGFKRKGKGTGAVFFLDRPGKMEAERFIEEIQNDELVGKWSPSKKNIKKRSNKSDDAEAES